VRKLAVVFVALGLAAVLALGGVAAAFSASTGAAGLSPASGIPAELVPLIERAAGAYCDLPPPLLAAVLKVESGFDNTAVNPRSGAFTMAQFLPGTWEEWKVNGNPDQNASIDPGDVADVIFSAAHYLCGLGAGNPDTQRLAIASYNAGPNAVEEAGGIPHEADCPEGHRRLRPQGLCPGRRLRRRHHPGAAGRRPAGKGDRLRLLQDRHALPVGRRRQQRLLRLLGVHHAGLPAGRGATPPHLTPAVPG